MKQRFAYILLILLIAIGCATDPYARLKGKDLHLVQEDRGLFWFSGIHSNDPEHPMFHDLEEAFVQFSPDVVLVEGNAERGRYSDAEQAIIHAGEPGFVAYLARSSGIPVQSIEPPWAAQFTYLLGHYEAEDVLVMYVLRQLNQYQREEDDRASSLSDRLRDFVAGLRRRGFPLPPGDVVNGYIAKLVEPYVGFSLDDSNWHRVPAKDIVYSSDTIPHRIWQSTIRFRDEYAVQLISEIGKDYDRVFVMMGADHIENQRNDLEALFQGR
jgi:hypothetical protein